MSRHTYMYEVYIASHFVLPATQSVSLLTTLHTSTRQHFFFISHFVFRFFFIYISSFHKCNCICDVYKNAFTINNSNNNNNKIHLHSTIIHRCKYFLFRFLFIVLLGRFVVVSIRFFDVIVSFVCSYRLLTVLITHST